MLRVSQGRYVLTALALTASLVAAQRPPASVPLTRVLASSADVNADDLRHPMSIESIGIAGDSLYLVDRRLPGIVVMDARSLRIVGAIARRNGGGPGELRVPARVVPWRGQLAVGDLGNGRITLFRLDGSVSQETPLPTPFAAQDFLITPHGSIVVAAGRAADHLLLAGDTMLRTPSKPLGARPVPASTDPSAGRRLLVGTRSSGDVLVVDEATGSLLSITRDGRVQTVWTAPIAYRDSVHQEREGIRRRNAPNVVIPVPFFADATLDSDRVLLLGKESLWRIDLTTQRVERFAVPRSSTGERPPRFVRQHGDRIILATDHEVFLIAPR
jgi:hypothetical protein